MTVRNSLTLVVFGATGDLYQNKLSSALFNLYTKGLLPKDFKVFGFARRNFSDKDFQNFTKENIKRKSANLNEESLDLFLNNFKYVEGDLENLESFKALGEILKREDEKLSFCTDKLFYLSVPPSLYEPIFSNISKSGLAVPCAPGMPDKDEAWTRVLVEKPFGNDSAHAKRLDKMLGELFDESQIFRIDHYLGKETAQQILHFRFENGELEKNWNNEHIEKVKINFHETNTIGSRGALYEGLGILRDVGQNHMLEMLALIAMEHPQSKNIKHIHHSRSEVLKKVSIIQSKEIVKGQYEGYKEEKNVSKSSSTETFFRVFLKVENERWDGVVFELEAGKALAKSEVIIEVYFKNNSAPHKFFISESKNSLWEPYEKVLFDCIVGDQTIFTTTEEIMAEWKVVESIIEKWQALPLAIYKVGSEGQEIK